jgi:hypothetical protein
MGSANATKLSFVAKLLILNGFEAIDKDSQLFFSTTWLQSKARHSNS